MKSTLHHTDSFSKFAFAWLAITALITGCATKTLEGEHSTPIVGQIIKIDEHGNAVTDIDLNRFAVLRCQLSDTLAVEFSNGQKIRIKYVSDYGDVKVDEYLGRFSTRRGLFKIAINQGNIADALKLESAGKVVLRKVEHQ